MAFVSLEAFHGEKRAINSIDELACPDVPEIVSCQGREKPEPDVRRRGPVRDAVDQPLLIVVRRELVVLRPDEGVEKAPGMARDPTEKREVRGLELTTRDELRA